MFSTGSPSLRLLFSPLESSALRTATSPGSPSCCTCTYFNGTAELDRKLLILHLANSVELILKDILLDVGESIYKEKNPKETVTVGVYLETLKTKGITVPYQNKIELLIDERCCPLLPSFR